MIPMRVLLMDPTNRAPLYFEQFSSALANLVDLWSVAPRRAGETMAGETQKWLWHGPGEGGAYTRISAYLKTWLIAIRSAHLFDVIHIQWLAGLARSSFDVGMLKLLLARNRRVAYTVHNVLPHGAAQEQGVVKRFSWLYQHVPLLFVHSTRTKLELAEQWGIPFEKITVIPHGPLLANVAIPFSVPRTEIRYHLAMIGRLAHYKGVEDAVQALAMVKEKHPEARLLLAGLFAQDYRGAISRLIHRYGLQEDVVLIDRRLSNDEVVALYERSGVALFPYRAISQSGALLTATALGVPVVCYNVGGFEEVVEEGSNGFIVPAGDIRQLACRTSQILSELETFQREAGRLRDRLSWNESAKRAVEAYVQLR